MIKKMFHIVIATQKQNAASKPIKDTSLLEYLDVVKNEYSIERSKRQSFETRAGIIVTLLAAMCIFLLEKIKIYDIVKLLNIPCSPLNLISIISGIGFYIAFLCSLFFAIKTISVQQYYNFDVSKIDEQKLGEFRIKGTIRIVKAYKEIILQQRSVNGKSANWLSYSFRCLVASILCLLIFINI